MSFFEIGKITLLLDDEVFEKKTYKEITKVLNKFKPKQPQANAALTITLHPLDPDRRNANINGSLSRSILQRFSSYNSDTRLKNRLLRYLEHEESLAHLQRLLDNKYKDMAAFIISSTLFVFDGSNQGILFFEDSSDYAGADLPEKSRSWFLSLRLRSALQGLLSHFGDGHLFHASGIEKDGKGFLFVGPGNSGKSTIVRLLKDYPCFSDDNVIVRFLDGDYRMFSTPWWNIPIAKENLERLIPCEKGIPLNALFFIIKSDSTRIEPVSSQEALGSLVNIDDFFRNTRVYSSRSNCENSLNFCHRLTSDIPVFKLHVKNNVSFEDKFVSELKKRSLL